MPETASYRQKEDGGLRVLFCVGVSQTFFEEESDGLKPIIDAITEAFDDLEGRFGVRVLGTLDDDELMVGPSQAWPWTGYILADAPDLDAVTKVTNLVRATNVGRYRLWRYLRLEARVGRKMFFGNE